jgi:hypothetical protein
MKFQELLHKYFERICWLIICEFLSLGLLMFIFIQKIKGFTGLLLIELVIFFQFPAIRFISDFFFIHRIDKVKRFFLRVLFILGIVVTLAILVFILIWDIKTSAIGMFFFLLAVVVMYKPEWIKKLVFWKKSKPPKK